MYRYGQIHAFEKKKIFCILQIRIYSHQQPYCLLVYQLLSVAGHARCSKARIETRLILRQADDIPLSQAYALDQID